MDRKDLGRVLLEDKIYKIVLDAFLWGYTVEDAWGAFNKAVYKAKKVAETSGAIPKGEL